MNKANLLQFLNLAVFPPLLFLFFHNSLEEILNLTGGLWIATAGITILFTPIRSAAATTVSDVKSLLRFGIQRVPGDFMMMALLTLPVTFLAHFQGIQQAGYLAFAISVLTTIGAIFSPVGLVLLPKATFMFAGGSHDELRRHVLWILKITLVVCVALTLTFFFLAPILIGLYLGPGYVQVIKFARIVVIAAVPYSIYLVLRNLIDAFHENGVTTGILGCSLCIFVCGVGLGKLFGHTNEFVVPAFLSAVFTLMLLCGLECIRIFRRRKASA